MAIVDPGERATKLPEAVRAYSFASAALLDLDQPFSTSCTESLQKVFDAYSISGPASTDWKLQRETVATEVRVILGKSMELNDGVNYDAMQTQANVVLGRVHNLQQLAHWSGDPSTFRSCIQKLKALARSFRTRLNYIIDSCSKRKRDFAWLRAANCQ